MTKRKTDPEVRELDKGQRPKNREVENEMICPPQKEGKPPRPKTEPKDADR